MVRSWNPRTPFGLRKLQACAASLGAHRRSTKLREEFESKKRTRAPAEAQPVWTEAECIQPKAQLQEIALNKHPQVQALFGNRLKGYIIMGDVGYSVINSFIRSIHTSYWVIQSTYRPKLSTFMICRLIHRSTQAIDLLIYSYACCLSVYWLILSMCIHACACWRINLCLHPLNNRNTALYVQSMSRSIQRPINQ